MSEENDKPSLKSRLHIPAWLNIPFIIIIVGAVMILFSKTISSPFTKTRESLPT